MYALTEQYEKQIETVREELSEAVKSKKGNLLDTDVLSLSQFLDKLIVTYMFIRINIH